MDGDTPLAGDSELRLRLAFKLDAQDLKDGAGYSYTLPEGLTVDDADALSVFSGTGADTGSETGAVTASGLTASIKENILTISYAGDESEDSEGTVSFYVDIDFTFAGLTTDDEGLAKLKLNNKITLTAVKAQEAAAAEETASTASASEITTTDNGTETATAAAAAAESTTSESEVSSAKAATAEADAEVAATAESADASTDAAAETESSDENAATASSPVDASAYLTSATLYKNVNNSWQVTTIFNDGDSARVELGFTFANGVITSTSKDATYQLPDGVRPVDAISNAVIYDNANQQVGTFDVSTDGLVTMHFSDSFATGNTIVASLYFKGWVTRTGSASDGTIQFGTTGTNITVNAVTTNDIHVSKEGTLNVNRDGATYKITVTSNNGTGGNHLDINDTVHVRDNITYTDFYDHSSLQVIKKTSSTDAGTPVTIGTLSSTTGGVMWNTTNGKPHFLLQLPILNAGESYEITYTASFTTTDDDIDSNIGNTVQANSATQGVYDAVNLTSRADDLKTGAINGSVIDWTVTLNRNNKSLAGFQMTDNLPGDLKGEITVSDADGNPVLTLSESNNYQATASGFTAKYEPDNNRLLTITVADGSTNTGTYKVSYSTKPTESASGTNTNTANTVYAGSTTHSVSATVGIGSFFSWGLKKTATSADFQGHGKYRIGWQTVATAPANLDGSYTITDTIESLYDRAQGGAELSAAGHYVTAGNLLATLQASRNILIVNSDTGVTYYSDGLNADGTIAMKVSQSGNVTAAPMTVTVTMYDGDGTVVSNDGDSHVKSFTVTATPADGASLAGTTSTLKYWTITDTTAAGIPDGADVYMRNRASVGGLSSEANTVVRQASAFDKQMYIGSWSNATKTMQYDRNTFSNNKLTFRLLVDTTDKSGNIVIEDLLPEGLEYVANSARLVKLRANGIQEDSKGSVTPTITTENGQQKLTFTLSSYDATSQYYIRYDTTWSNDNYWSDAANINKTYTNTASLGDTEKSSSFTVHREPTFVIKTGSQGTGSNADQVTYSVVINPLGSDIDANSDTLVLTDTLSNFGVSNPVLSTSDVRLYAYNETAEGHRGAELSSALYTVSYDASSHTMRVTVPDSLGCVLVYSYTLKGFRSMAGSITMSNSASLAGQYSDSASAQIAASDAGGHAVQAQLTLYKVDADNYQTLLSGAQFDFYSGEGGSFGEPNSFTLDNGSKTWDLYDTNGQAILAHDTLYKFVETKAPDGYQLSSEPIYLVWLSDGESEETAWQALQNSGILSSATKSDGTHIAQSDVHFIAASGGAIYAPNKYDRLTVNKIFTAPDGTTLNDDQIGVTSITVKLYQDVKNSDGTITKATDAYETTTIIAAEGWKKTWDGLPKKDANGNEYVYRVEEEGLEHSYRDSYLNNDVQTGTITINNTQTYQLPKTGGIGDMPFAVGGAALAAAAVAAFVALRCRIS
ncbi:MAG: Cna B-type domain-containing protein [Atopobiaceae bacterium]